MGLFVNPGNDAFQMALNSEIYVDKTGLLEYTNRVMDTKQAFICNSRPRRFGKSTTADMLVAYYSCGCDSRQIFEGTAISQAETFHQHLNQYDVIRLDIQWFLASPESVESLVERINKNVVTELREHYPDELQSQTVSLAEGMSRIHEATGKKFVVVIDEWDVLIREEAEDVKVQKEYIDFLRTLFKGSHPTEFLHLAYLTGILPIKRVKTQSALNNFYEFSMLSAKTMAQYIGFTEEEVRALCQRYHQDFERVKCWYDGYRLGKFHVYNPNAVINLMLWGEFQSYWSQTGTYESIIPFINMDFDGLKTAIIQMLSGGTVEVDVNTFRNDMVSFQNKDDVLTLLIHLGYLAYDQVKGIAFIPNEEIRQEFQAAVKKKKWDEFLQFQQESKELLDATLNGEDWKVAQGIERIHTQFASSIQYNDENSLSSVLTIGYLAAMQYYFMPIREMPTGRGFADYVFLPKPEYIEEIPALLVELKWNTKAETALKQIKEKRYVEGISGYTGKILLVGIAYDKKSKEHECVIEEYSC
nr:AAA family ATPase [uncultured Blautia sp.]